MNLYNNINHNFNKSKAVDKDQFFWYGCTNGYQAYEEDNNKKWGGYFISEIYEVLDNMCKNKTYENLQGDISTVINVRVQIKTKILLI